MRNRTIFFAGVVCVLAAGLAGPAQAAPCATVVECANQMVGIATDLRAQNAQLVTKNTELQTRVEALENQVRDQARRLDDANKGQQSLRTDLSRVASKALPQERNKCQKIDGGHPGDDFWCPTGMYLAGAENTSNSNSTVDMMWCCPSN